MNKQSKTQRRVVNFDINDFQVMKTFCDDNSLKMPDWLVKLARDETKRFSEMKREPLSKLELCPKCQSVIGYSHIIGGYFCPKCDKVYSAQRVLTAKPPLPEKE